MVMFSGSIVAIATPMHDDASLDLPGLQRLIDWHIGEGTDGIVIVGTTGESPTVNHDEHCLLIKTAIEHAARRVPVIAGTGANSTAEAIELTRFAKSAGADACLSVVPYYNRPTQEGLELTLGTGLRRTSDLGTIDRTHTHDFSIDGTPYRIARGRQ